MTTATFSWLLSKAIPPARQHAAGIGLFVSALFALMLATAGSGQNVRSVHTAPTSATRASAEDNRARVELQRRYGAAIDRIEAENPELNLDSASYNPKVVKSILLYKKMFEADGLPSDFAMTKAIALHYPTDATAPNHASFTRT